MIYLRKNEGIAFFMVVLLLVVVGAISAALLTMYTSNIRISGDSAEKTKAFYAAEAGVNYLDRYVHLFNEEKGSLGFYAHGYDYTYDYRVDKARDSIINKLDEKKLKVSGYDISFNEPNNDSDDDNNDLSNETFVIEVKAENGDKVFKINVEYRVAPGGQAYFAHTLAARSIDMKNYSMTLRDNFPGSEDFSFIATAESSDLASINKDNIILTEKESFLFLTWDEPLTGSEYNAAYNNTFQFYGDGEEQLYLPESDDADRFTEYVRSVNFREVLKQNGITDYVYEDEDGEEKTIPLSQFYLPDKDEKDESEDDEKIVRDIRRINPEMNSNNLDLKNFSGIGIFPDSLNGFFQNFDELQSLSDSNTGPYIYIDEFDFTPNSSNYEIDFSDINSADGVVQLYIDDNIDFSDTDSNIYFHSSNEKSVLVQSGGSKINLDNNRILYYSNTDMKGIAYYAPNAEMRISGDMPGTGWGQSYNVNNIVLDGDVTFPPMVYDPEDAGLFGNIHADLADYFTDDEELEDKFAGQVFRRDWSINN